MASLGWAGGGLRAQGLPSSSGDRMTLYNPRLFKKDFLQTNFELRLKEGWKRMVGKEKAKTGGENSTRRQ